MASNRMVFLGPPGAGKGTHAAWLAEDRGLQHISTGDMLRVAVKAGTEIGLAAKVYMDQGKLIPDDIMIDVLFGDISDTGWILDGFPRTVAQAEALDKRLAEYAAELDGVVLFEVDRQTLIDRLMARMTCEACGAVYNRLHRKPLVEGVCDVCGGKLQQRVDDRPGAVTERLAVYDKQTRPLVEFYDRTSRLTRIDARGAIEDVRLAMEPLLP